MPPPEASTVMVVIEVPARVLGQVPLAFRYCPGHCLTSSTTTAAANAQVVHPCFHSFAA